METLVALAVGGLLLVGATYAFAKARDAQRSFDGRARMRESALHALAVIETDVRMAGYRGLTNTPPVPDSSVAFPAKCGGDSWVTEPSAVGGSNGNGLGRPDCPAGSGGPQPGSDALLIRRASARMTPLAAGKVPAAMRGRVLVGATLDSAVLFVASTDTGDVPGDLDVTAHPLEIREWLVNAYYVSRGSSAGARIPGLRRKTLQLGPDIGDEELVAGVEDLQVVIGADVDGDGLVDADFPADGLPTDAHAVFVRIWIRVRSPVRDAPPGGAQASSYADRYWPPIDDGFSRLMLSRTIYLRNR